MKVVLRTNEDDWEEISWGPLNGDGYAGHSIPEFIWIKILHAAGVAVEVVFDEFGLDNFENEGGQQ